MIGQNNLLISINKLIEQGFPRFTIITGEKGQGKKTIAHEISRKLSCPLVVCGIKVDEIRSIIELAYKQTEPIIYLIPDADKMSLGAKNSLLKVIEEPPNNAIFIMTLQTIENTLGTIRSRCQELKMDNYDVVELNKFMDIINPNVNSLEKTIAVDIAENYYELEILNKYGITDFYKYVEKVVDNIYKVQSANSFKIIDKINVKDDDTKYDINLFLRTFKSICINRLVHLVDEKDAFEFKLYARSISETSDAMNQLSITGINKQSLLDIWILNIRKIWREN